MLAPDERPTKKKPEDPGGLVVPNSDSLVYEKLQSGIQKKRKVNILPEPEEPLELLKKADDPVIFLDSIDEILANIESYEDVLAKDEAIAEEVDELVMPNDLKAKPVSKSQDDEEEIIIPGTSLSIIRSAETRFYMQDVEITNNENAGYKVQLAVAFSQSDANARWQEITRRHGRILQGANLITRKVEGKNERIFYVVMAGTYPSLSYAKLVCKRLISHKQNCIVTK